MIFEWNPSKAAANLQKHKVVFQEATTIFEDPLAYTFPDPKHSQGEERWLTFGHSAQGRLLVVSHLEHNEHLRIVGARRATRHDRKIYEEGQGPGPRHPST